MDKETSKKILDDLCVSFKKKLDATNYKHEDGETIIYKKGNTLLVVKNRK